MIDNSVQNNPNDLLYFENLYIQYKIYIFGQFINNN